MTAALGFHGIGKSFARPDNSGQRHVLRNFDLEIREGELVSLVGRSGVGKTTLLHIAAGLERPDQGRFVAGTSGRQARVGMVFQQPRLLEWRTVRQNIDLIAAAAGRAGAGTTRLLEQVGLGEYASAFPGTLSGGQRQRVAIARAFAIDPGILLLDEPFSALDELTARRLRLVLQDLWSSAPPAGLLVTHNMLEAAFLSDRIVVLGGSPARAIATIEVTLPRPRDPEHPELFTIHRRIMKLLSEPALSEAPPARR